MLTNDQESLDGTSRATSIAEHRAAGSGALLSDTSLREDWCDGEEADSHCIPHGPSSYPLTLERSTSEFGGEGGGFEGGAGTADSDEFSDVGEPGDTEVVFVKEGVNVWPSRSERIMGRLSLIKQHGVLFLAWLPYTPGSLLEDGSFHAAAAEVAQSMQSAKERTLYAVHPIPLSDIKAIHRHTPPLGTHKIVVTLFNGVSLAPLYFQQGGIKAFFSALRQHGHLMRSAHDPNTYLVNDTADPLQRSLTSMELTDVLLGAPPAGASATFPPPAGRYAEEGWRDAELEVPLVSQLTHLVDRFQRGITSAKATASSFFTSSFMLPPEEPPSPPHHPPAGPASGLPVGADLAASFGSTCPDPGADSEGAGVTACPAAGPAEGSGLVGDHEAQRGECDLRGATTELGVFEIIERSNAGASASSPLWTRARPPPLTREELDAFCDREGRLVDVGSFRQRVFYGGVEPEARPLVWKLLLGLFPEGASREERRRLEASQQDEYLALRRQWSSISREQAARFAKWRERKARIEKDVRRTDRSVRLFSKEGGQGQQLLRRLLLSYAMYNFDLGYCQGMSDLAAPILYVMRSQVCGSSLTPEESLRVESQAFWCFVRLMDRMEPNFSTDCTGMHAQLVALRRLVQLLDPPLYSHLEAADCLNFYFCYRWCLIHFKRELGFEEVLRLWEALWTGHPSPQLHLYICVALLEHHRREIMGEALDFDGLLKFCVELSGKLDLAALLRDSEVLCKYAGEAGGECVAGLPVLAHMQREGACRGLEGGG